MSVCFFIGHRDAPSQVRELLESAVERHICLYGVTDFYVGRYGRFDSMAANAVKSAKTRHPGVTLTMLLAYHPYERPIQTPDGFDGTFYPPIAIQKIIVISGSQLYETIPDNLPA